jgi:hypothetical protein
MQDGVSPPNLHPHPATQRYRAPIAETTHLIARALTKPLRTRRGHSREQLVERLRPVVAGLADRRGLRLFAKGHPST